MTIDPSLLQRDMEIIRKKRGEDAIRMSDQVQERTRIFMPEFPTLMAITMLTAVLLVAGNLLADVAYAIVDPRIRYT